MKQLVAVLAVLIAVVAGISWATSRSSSAQEQDPPVETPAPLEDLRNPEPASQAAGFQSTESSTSPSV